MRQLLAQEHAPADDDQRRLTEHHLEPAVGHLRTELLALRLDLDRALATQVSATSHKVYPLGCCHEITTTLLPRLRVALARPRSPGMAALAGFLAAGGRLRHIWGVLRERYFQNALQVGTFYVDVANDTVDPAKPPVEIMPFEDAGFAAVRGPEHFARVAARYWGADTFANYAVPELAPLLPMITEVPGQPPRLQSVTDYMTDLFRRDAFLGAEAWLAAAPPPPEPIASELRTRWMAASGTSLRHGFGRDEAVEACRAARRAGHHRDMGWRDARVADYVRAFGQPAARPG